MSTGTIGKSTYSKQVASLINRISDKTAVADSLYEQATACFIQMVAQQSEKTELAQQVYLFEHRQQQVDKRDLAQVERSLQQAQELGFDSVLALRALLSAVVQQSKAVRNAEDLADELRFLAENLDDDQDYGFMRP